MEFVPDFTAIDFETANRRPDSACQLGLVKIRGGQIVDQASWLIQPKPLFFQRTNIEIHGITPDQVRGEPQFGELWSEIADTLSDDCLVAHNASFDMRVLLACLRTHRQQVPELQYTCTRAIARRTWPHQRRFGLKPLSTWLGIRFRHHDALEDATACARILLAAGIDREATTLPELEKRLRLRRGKAGPWGMRGPTGSSSTRRRRVESSGSSTGLPFLLPNEVAEHAESLQKGQATGMEPASQLLTSRASVNKLGTAIEIDLQRIMIRAEFIRPLAGRQVVVAGRFRVMTGDDARRLATSSGANCQTTIDESTDLLVVGKSGSTRQSVSHQREGEEPADLAREAEQRQAKGQDIQVVSEDEFLTLVQSSP